MLRLPRGPASVITLYAYEVSLIFDTTAPGNFHAGNFRARVTKKYACLGSQGFFQLMNLPISCSAAAFRDAGR